MGDVKWAQGQRKYYTIFLVHTLKTVNAETTYLSYLKYDNIKHTVRVMYFIKLSIEYYMLIKYTKTQTRSVVVKDIKCFA